MYHNVTCSMSEIINRDLTPNDIRVLLFIRCKTVSEAECTRNIIRNELGICDKTLRTSVSKLISLNLITDEKDKNYYEHQLSSVGAAIERDNIKASARQFRDNSHRVEYTSNVHGPHTKMGGVNILRTDLSFGARCLHMAISHYFTVNGYKKIFIHDMADMLGISNNEAAAFLCELREADDCLWWQIIELLPKTPDHIYFIRADIGSSAYPIKIGTTHDVKIRLSSLQSGSPYNLSLLGVISGGRVRESEIHSKFNYLKVSGEWFRSHPDLLKFIKDNCK